MSVPSVEDKVRLRCADCKTDLYLSLQIVAEGDYGLSIARETSVMTTLAWASERFFRCGTCFVKLMREKKRERRESNKV